MTTIAICRHRADRDWSDLPPDSL